MTTSLLRLVADLDLSLGAQVFAGDTTGSLNDDVDSDNVTLPAGLYGLTISLGENDKEYIVCNLNGTSLTNVSSISEQGTATAGFSTYHRSGATVTITDWAVLKRILDNMNGTTGFDASQPLGYDGAPSGISGNQFATVNYVLSVVNGGPVTFDREIFTNQTAGEALTEPQVVYFKESDQRWYKADAITNWNQVDIGVAIVTAAGAGSGTSVQRNGLCSVFSGLTPGSKYYLTDAAGGVSITPGTNRVLIGWALNATTIILEQKLIRPQSVASTYTPAAAATSTLDLAVSNQHDITMPAGNITIALSNASGNQIFAVSITQDSVGSRTVTWFTTIKWSSGITPVLTTTANKRDMFVFKRTGVNTYDGFVVGQNI